MLGVCFWARPLLLTIVCLHAQMPSAASGRKLLIIDVNEMLLHRISGGHNKNAFKHIKGGMTIPPGVRVFQRPYACAFLT